MTIEFYSAQPQELLSLFVALKEDEDVDEFVEKLENYPQADFSLHLHFPEDLDSMCQVLRSQNDIIPSTFSELIVKELFHDGTSEWLMLLDIHFTQTLAEMSTRAIEQAALTWANTFPYHEPLQQTPAYTSMLQLREVATDAVMCNKSLLFYLEGNPAFFKW